MSRWLEYLVRKQKTVFMFKPHKNLPGLQNNALKC